MFIKTQIHLLKIEIKNKRNINVKYNSIKNDGTNRYISSKILQ